MNPLAALGWQRYLVYGALLLAAAALVWFHGYTRGEIKLFEYQAAQARAAIPVIVKQGAVTEKIVTRWRTVEKTIELEGKTIEKEIVRYVPPAADPVLGLGWLRLHDAAATGAVPPPTEGIDVAAPAIAASTALRGVTGNYLSCRLNAAQLAELQDWVRQQFQVMNLEKLGY